MKTPKKSEAAALAEQEAIEQWGMAQAYQVIGALAHVTGTFETPEVQAALDYFCECKYRDAWPTWIAPKLAKEPATSEGATDKNHSKNNEISQEETGQNSGHTQSGISEENTQLGMNSGTCKRCNEKKGDKCEVALC